MEPGKLTQQPTFKSINKNSDKLTSLKKYQLEIPITPNSQLTPTERYYEAIADKFPDPDSYLQWKARKQKASKWNN